MSIQTHRVSPSLEAALRAAAAQFARRARARAWLYFGITTLAIVAAFTGLLMLFPVGDSRVGAGLVGVALLVEAAAAWYWLYLERRRTVSLTELALYIDQTRPELQNRIISAVEFGDLDREKCGVDSESVNRSLWMIERFLEETEVVARSTSLGDLVNERTLVWMARSAVVLFAACAVVVATFHSVWLPDFRALWGFDRPVVVTEFDIQVTPGDAEIRKGDRAIIVAETNAPGREALLVVQPFEGAEEVFSMSPASDAKVWHYDFPSVQTGFRYKIRVGSIESPTYSITTWIPPETQAIHLTYTYPDYLNRPVEEAPNSGPIVAVEGTRVKVTVDVNKTMTEASLVFDDGTDVPLVQVADLTWSGELLLEENGRYHVALLDPQGHSGEYQPSYDVKALPDEAPKVRIAFPRGDDEATAIEEIPFAFEVTDDFGIASYGIQYEVAGKEPVQVTLGEPPIDPAAPVLSNKGEHLLMLEDLELEVGDLLTWTVWARDGKPGRDRFEELGDPFFLEIRPFHREFMEAVSNAGGQQQQQQQMQQPGEQSADQKQIIIATWNLRRSAQTMTEVEFAEKRSAIVAAQKQLLEGMQGALGAGRSMEDVLSPEALTPEAVGAMGEPSIEDLLVEAQRNAVTSLEAAALPEPGDALSEAMEHEKKALSLINKLNREEGPVQVAMSRGQSQGQGGGAQQREIDQLEMDRARNFYEEEQSAQQPEAQAAREDALSALEELAQRQQLANEEMARLISELQLAQTDEEREAIRRQLERLEEELANNLESVDQLASEVASGQMDREQAAQAQRNLSQARGEMNRALESMRQERLQQARAAGTRAANTLEEMQRDLSGLSRSAAEGHLNDLTRQMEGLEARQSELLEEIERLREEESARSLDALHEQAGRQKELIAEHERMAGEFEEVMRDASQLAEGTRESQELLSRKLNDWLRETSQRGVSENLRDLAPLLNHGIWDPLIESEEKIAENLRAAAESLREVGEYHVENELEALRMARREIGAVLDPNGDFEESGEEARGAEPTGQVESEQPDGESSTSEESGRPGEPQDGAGSTPRSEGLSESSEQTRGASRLDGERSGSGGGYGPDDVERFIERDFGRWLEGIRNAEALLPDAGNEAETADGLTTRRRLERVREAIGDMRREYRNRGVSPQFEGFIDRVVNPLTEAAAEIDREILERMQVDEYAIAHEADVPAQYRDQVADYFRALSEAAASSE